MPDPTSGAAGSFALAATTVTLTGGMLGVDYDALIYATLGTLCTLKFLAPMSHRQLLITIITTPIIAALFAPLGAALVAQQFDALVPYREQQLRLSVAAIIAMCLQVVLPSGLDFLRRWFAVKGV